MPLCGSNSCINTAKASQKNPEEMIHEELKTNPQYAACVWSNLQSNSYSSTEMKI